jgi:hypothetical protein
MTGADRLGDWGEGLDPDGFTGSLAAGRGEGLDPDGFAGSLAAGRLGNGFTDMSLGVGAGAAPDAVAGALVVDVNAAPVAVGPPDVVAKASPDAAAIVPADAAAAAGLALSCTFADPTVTAVAVTPCFSSKLVMALR